MLGKGLVPSYSSITVDDFTCILRDEFKRCIAELPYEEMRQSIFTEELVVAYRLLVLSERICKMFYKLHDKFYILTRLIYYVTSVKIFQQVLYILFI